MLLKIEKNHLTIKIHFGGLLNMKRNFEFCIWVCTIIGNSAENDGFFSSVIPCWSSNHINIFGIIWSTVRLEPTL